MSVAPERPQSERDPPHARVTPAQSRVILHADMDAFYASVEQRDNPELRGKPVIIGASSPRGVVAAASYEARAFGVRSAMPGFEAKRRCPHGIFLGGDMTRYVAVSRQVHAVFREFTDQIEPLSLDEAFLDITGSVALLGPPRAIGAALKRRVLDVTRLPVSVGIATSKLVAKIACSQGKPNGLFCVSPGAERELLAPLPVRALFGVGPKTEQRLLGSGLRTIGDIAVAPMSVIRAVFGRFAETMQARARGIDERPVEPDRAAKSIGEEATFPDDVSARDRLESAVCSHAETVAERARRAGLQGRTVSVKVKLSQRNEHLPGVRPAHHELFPQLTRQQKLDAPTSDGAIISAVAKQLLEKLRLSAPIRLLGVSLSDLEAAGSPRQLDLFARNPRSERLGQALDAINDKFGAGSIARAATAQAKVTAGNRIKLGERSDEHERGTAATPEAPPPEARHGVPRPGR